MMMGRFGGGGVPSSSSWNESAHPREPAGVSIGGQFTTSNGGSDARQLANGFTKNPRAFGQLDAAAIEALPSYESHRTHPADAVTVVGVHYSQVTRETISSDYYGHGMRGAEAQRLDGVENSDIRPRTYFYVDKGNGVRNEDGVGGYAHAVKLTNMYSPEKDNFALWRTGKGDANASERAVMKAGYDGYYASFGNATQGVAVLIGHHSVNVVSIGRRSDIPPRGY